MGRKVKESERPGKDRIKSADGKVSTEEAASKVQEIHSPRPEADRKADKKSRPSVYWGTLDTRDLLPGRVPASEGTSQGLDMGRKKSGSATPTGDDLQSSYGLKSSLALPGHALGEQDTDKLSLGTTRDSTFVSLDSLSRRSVDYNITNTTALPVVTSSEDKSKSLVQADDALIREAIPFLPLPLAVICLVINMLLPGIGTIISGFSIFCCGKTRVPTKDDHVMVTFCVNVWVGVAQLLTIPLFLVGWFWSVAWGVKMVIHSIEHRKEQRIQRDKDLQELALSAFGSPNRGRLFPV